MPVRAARRGALDRHPRGGVGRERLADAVDGQGQRPGIGAISSSARRLDVDRLVPVEDLHVDRRGGAHVDLHLTHPVLVVDPQVVVEGLRQLGAGVLERVDLGGVEGEHVVVELLAVDVLGADEGHRLQTGGELLEGPDRVHRLGEPRHLAERVARVIGRELVVLALAELAHVHVELAVDQADLHLLVAAHRVGHLHGHRGRLGGVVHLALGRDVHAAGAGGHAQVRSGRVLDGGLEVGEELVRVDLLARGGLGVVGLLARWRRTRWAPRPRSTTRWWTRRWRFRCRRHRRRSARRAAPRSRSAPGCGGG